MSSKRTGSTLFLFLALTLLHNPISAQAPAGSDLVLKKVSDTVLGRRTFTVRDPFDANHALRKLFPGKWYDLNSGPRHVGRLINWICPSCKPVAYPDANREDTAWFPDPGGVATRLLRVFSYTDSAGKQYKLMSFNHSAYDPDGLQMGRFTGGLVGMARFVRVDSGWELQHFQPAIGAYGSFSQAPTPEPLLIGEHQYAYLLEHSNGGPGGPYWLDYYLVADVGNAYRQILFASGYERTEGFDGKSSWKCTYRIVPGEAHAFRKFVFICKGSYSAPDAEGLPKELEGKVKGREQGKFTITHVFVYSDQKGYQERLPAKVSISRNP